MIRCFAHFGEGGSFCVRLFFDVDGMPRELVVTERGVLLHGASLYSCESVAKWRSFQEIVLS